MHYKNPKYKNLSFAILAAFAHQFHCFRWLFYFSGLKDQLFNLLGIKCKLMIFTYVVFRIVFNKDSCQTYIAI